jgi:hypothetical protein
MGSRKQSKKPERPVPPTRDRIDLRADPFWIARIERQAARFGTNLSAYIREAVTLKLEADEQSDPDADDA